MINEIEKHDNIALQVIDPSLMTLAFPGTDPGSADAKALQDAVLGATGIIFSTPEYHGTYSSMTKLLIENLGFPSVLAGKPVALLGVAAGQIGAIKALEHLRSVLSHIGAIVLPGSISVPGVQSLFDDEGQCLDEAVEARIRSVATTLADYIRTHVCPRLTLEEMLRRGPAFQWTPPESRPVANP